ncbi:MAG: tetratricopeptide repeat protein [Pseudomonadota bacterium]
MTSFNVSGKVGLSLKHAYTPQSDRELEETTGQHCCLACGRKGQFVTGDLGPLRELGPLKFYRGAMKCQCGYMNFTFVVVNDLKNANINTEISTSEAMTIAERDSVFPDWRVEELLNLASAAAHNQSFDEAKDLTEQCLAFDDNNQAAWYNMGWLYTNTQDIPNAVRAYEKVISIGDSFPSAHLNLGYIYEEAGDLQNAVISFERFLNRYPNHVGAKKRLETCQDKLKSA